MLAPFVLRFLCFFFLHFIHEASQISVLFLLLPPLNFFPCKTRSSTHLLITPSRFPPSTTTCRVRPWLVPKVSVISTIRLVLLRRFFSLSLFIFLPHRCVGGCVAIKSLLPLVFSVKRQNEKMAVLLLLLSQCLRAISRA